MIIYIDNDYKCHISDDSTMREVESEFFDGKCKQFVEGYRFIPAGESWTREDGVVFQGEMIVPWENYEILAQFQSMYEEARAEARAEVQTEMDDMQAALTTIYTGVSE